MDEFINSQLYSIFTEGQKQLRKSAERVCEILANYSLSENSAPWQWNMI